MAVKLLLNVEGNAPQTAPPGSRGYRSSHTLPTARARRVWNVGPPSAPLPGAPLQVSWEHCGGGYPTPSLCPAPPTPGRNWSPSPLPRPPCYCAALHLVRTVPPAPSPGRPPEAVPVAQASLPGPLPPFPLLPVPLARRPRGHSGRAGRAPLTWAGRREQRASPVVQQSWLPWVGLL